MIGAGFMLATQGRADVPEQQQNTSLAKPLVLSGIAAYERGDYITAGDELAKAQTLDSSNSASVLYLGLAYLKQNRLSDAISAWEKYIGLKPFTPMEKQNNLQATVTRDLTILLREQDHQQARQEIAHERQIGSGDPNTVAITYYRNLGSPELTPLQKGLTALVIADVAKAPGIKVVERDRMEALLDEMKLESSGLVDPKTAARTGYLLGAGRIVTGSYVDPVKGELRVDSVLAQTATARIIGNQNAGGPVLHFYDVEKQLSAAILKDLGRNESQLKAEGIWRKIQTPQTTNFRAFQAFSQGLDARDHQDYARARALFRQALADDPSFDLAMQELNRTPVQGMSIAEVASNVGSQAPSAAAVAVAFSQENMAASVPNLPTVSVISAPPPAPPPPLPPPPPVLPVLPRG